MSFMFGGNKPSSLYEMSFWEIIDIRWSMTDRVITKAQFLALVAIMFCGAEPFQQFWQGGMEHFC